MTGGPNASRRPTTASADCHRAGVGVFFPRADATEPLALLSRPLDSLSASRTFARAATSPHPSLLVWGVGRRVSRSPRPPLSPSRESRRVVTIRNTFHRQGPFVGSGDHYGPGPATRTPLLTTDEPLDDTLVPPWALRRSPPILGVRPTRDSVSPKLRADGFTPRHSF